MLNKQCFKTIKVLGFSLAMSCCSSLAIAMDTVDHSTMDHSSMDHGSMDHSQHMAMMNQKGYSRKEVTYQLPDVKLIDQYGNKISTATLLEGEDPVMLNFIFTSCTTICPVLSATFSQVQKQYNSELAGVKMVSISIDPEYDTPARLKDYAQRYNAQQDWTFLTGDLDTVVELLNAFDAYRGDKMSHTPLTFLRQSNTSPWLRLEGFTSAGELIKEYQTLKTGSSVNISQR